MADVREGHESAKRTFGGERAGGRGRGSGHNSTFHFNTVAKHAIGGKVTMFSPCSLISEAYAVPIPSPAPQYVYR